MAGRISLCVNTDILSEYEEKLAEKTTPEIARNVLEAITRLHTTVFQQVYFHFGLIEADPDDNKFVDCALAVGARFIVSNDHHYDILKSIDYPIIDVIAIRAFYEKNTMTFMPCRQQQTTK